MSTEQVKEVKPAAPQKRQITTEVLKELMLGGMNRKEIAAHLGTSVSTVNKFFKHPELSKLRPKHKSEFELVDSTGKTHSPGILAQAAKEAKEAEQAELGDVLVEVEATEEVAETAPEGNVVSESTGI